jgi:adenosine deaminase
MRFESLVRVTGLELPAPPKSFKGLRGMFDWSQAVVRPLARDPRMCPLLLEATVLDAAEDGVVALEMSMDIDYAMTFPSAERFARVAADITAKYADRVALRPEIGIKKDTDLDAAGTFIEALIESGVFKSIDLYGREVEPKSLFRYAALYGKAAKRGMKLKAHLGEFERFGRMRKVVETLGISAVQHGITCAKSARQLEWAKSKDLAFNVCPASNVALGASRSVDRHQARALFDAGLRVNVCTDDLILFGSSVTEQYLAFARAGIFRPEELDEMRRSGLEEAKR